MRRCSSRFCEIGMGGGVTLACPPHFWLQRGARARARRGLAALRSFLKYAAHRDVASLVVIQRALSVPMKRCDKPMVGFLSREEIQQLLTAPDPDTWSGQRDRVLLATMYNTGARVSEMLALRVSNVVLGSSPCFLIILKGQKQPPLPLCR